MYKEAAFLPGHIVVSAVAFCIFNFVSQCSNVDVYCYDFEDHSGMFGTQISLKGLCEVT